MPSFVIEDFKIGLDKRRMNEVSPAGSLIQCENAHITRGGDIEKAEALLRFVGLPANTFGLLAIPSGFLTFGSDNITPTVLKSNPPVRYQRLNPGGGVNMIRVISSELFNSKAYVVAEFSDGVIRHYYDGALVAAFFSGKARARFTLSAPSTAAAVSSSGRFTILSPGVAGNTITSITVNAVNILAATVTVVDPNTFVQDVVDAINSNSAVSGYSAVVQATNRVVISAQIPGTTPNGYAITVVKTGAINVQSIVAFAGGAIASRISNITVNAVSILNGQTIDWAETDSFTARAIAAAINDYTATSGYEAYAVGSQVEIRRTVDSAAPNGFAVVISTTGAVPITITTTPTTMAGGSATPTNIEPGRFAKTMKNKMYLLTGVSMYFSAVGAPTDMAGTGSGFINLSANTSGAEQPMAMANYFQDLAVFSRETIQVWFVDADPTLNQQLQVLGNTGTIAPKSVVEFGSNDVFYLSDSGFRSLRARDTTNAAFVNDVGIAIDELVQNEILTNSLAAENSVGILEPRNGRYMCAIGTTVYVFSFFPSSKISAWSTYKPGFTIEDFAYLGQLVICRSRNSIYKIGSAGGQVYDAKKVTVTTPFHAAKDPSQVKSWQGIDMACQGTWEIYAAFDPLQPDVFEEVGTVTNTTYDETGGENGHVPLGGISAHIALKLINRTSGYARVGSIEIHFEGGEKE